MPETAGSPDDLLRDCVFTAAGTCTTHGDPVRAARRCLGSPPTPVDLARETPYSPSEWQHALNALGDRAATLLPTVKSYALRQHLTPHAAACAVLEVSDGT